MKFRIVSAMLAVLCFGGCSMIGAAGQAPYPSLSGTTWRVVQAGVVDVPPAMAPPPFVKFDAAMQRIEGSSGVNRLTGIVDVEGRSMRLVRISSTRRAGPPDAMRFEQELLRALELTSYYRISGSQLVLRDSAGKTLAYLIADSTAAAQ